MADLGKVEGGKQGPSPEGPKRKKGAEPDRFREMMKSGKVRETDPEEQRKRKSQAEREEEEAAEMTTAQPSNREMIVPTPSADFEIKVPQSAGVAPAEEPAPTPQASIYEPPSPPPVAEEDTTISTPQQPRTERRKQVQQQQQQKKVPIVEKAKQPEKKQPPLEKKETPVQTKPHIEEAPKPKKQEQPAPSAEEAVAMPQAPTQLPQGAWEATEDLERGEEKLVKKVAPVKKEEPVVPTTFQTGAPAPVILPGNEPLPPIASPFAHLSAPVAALFERMVGVMTVMSNTTEGVTQTTINLDNPKFANSPFFGAQIIISEFSTAPKAYNIQLLGNQQAVTLFNNNVQELVAAFQAGNYTFKVNRIDTGYLSAPDVRKREVRRVKRKRGAE